VLDRRCGQRGKTLVNCGGANALPVAEFTCGDPLRQQEGLRLPRVIASARRPHAVA